MQLCNVPEFLFEHNIPENVFFLAVIISFCVVNYSLGLIKYLVIIF